MKKENRGGKRKNSGRKKLPAGEKQVEVSGWVKEKNFKRVQEALNKIIEMTES